MIPVQKNFANLTLLEPTRKMHWEKLAINCNDEIRFIAYVDILYCKSNSNYTTIFRRDGSTFLCCKTLKDIESKLPSTQFVRIHQSYLVNLQYVTALKKQAAELEVNDRITLPVSRSYKAGLYRMFDV